MNPVTPAIRWKAKSFTKLTNDELYELIKFRVDIFMVEQQCLYDELDDKDRHPQSLHLLGYDHTHQLVAYARLLPPGISYPEVSIGRFAVHLSAREQGLGSRLLVTCLEEIEYHWPNAAVRISAQAHLARFYGLQRFKKVSAEYLEDGIPHIEMLRSP